MNRIVDTLKRPQPSAAAVLAALLLATAATAQAQTGRIAGTVTDEQGMAIAGAQILIEETQQGALSNATGAYTIRDVPEGAYTLRITFLGYRTESVTVNVRPSAETTQDFTLVIDPLGLEGIVVTATRTPRLKLESSTAITTLSSQDIERDEPRSTADLLKSVPGFYVESSGGEVGNNVFVRGLPADGSLAFVVPMEDGMPAFDVPDLFFLNGDNFLRTDKNIDRLEAVRGGNSALFGSNTPGGVVNFISKTGGPELAGSLKISVGTDGLNRYDGNVNGPLAENWRFSIGGFYRFDDGVRDPGFPASRGGQLKANLTRTFDRGHIRFFAKYINDKNVFYLPLPLQPGKRKGDVVELESEFVSGFPGDGTLTTNEGNFVEIPLPQDNGELALPLQDGIAQVGGTGMVDLFFELDNDITIQNSTRVMRFDHQWNAVVPFEVLSATEFVQGFLSGAPAGATADLTFTSDGSTFNTPNNLLLTAGQWHVEKPVTNFSNQFQIKKLAVAGETTHDLTLGAYFGHYTANNLWFFNDILTDVRNEPKFVDLVVRDPIADTLIFATDNGFRRYLSLFVNGVGNGTIASVFGGDEIQLTDRLRVDFGARFERDEYEQNVENTKGFDLGDPETTADDNANWGTRTFKRVDVDFDEWAVSGGINYRINDQISVYGRGSRGFKMPLIDQYLFATDPTDPGFPDEAQELLQAEGGVKVSSPLLGLSAVAYWAQLSNFPSQDARVDPVTGETVFETAFVGEARTIGAEVEAVAVPYPGVRLNALVTAQDHEYTDFIEGGEVRDGNWVRRIPRVVLDLGGSYTSQGFSIGGDWNFFGKRFANNANTIELPEFGYVNARASYLIPGQGVTLSVAALNLLDGEGLTEGNPRLDEAGAPSGPSLARPILPQRFVFAVGYDF